MEKELEIKASNEVEALKIAKDQIENSNNFLFEVIEIKKSKSIFGLINRNGFYKVKVTDKAIKKEEKSKEKVLEEKDFINLEEKITEKVAIILDLMDLDLKTTITKEGKDKYLLDLNGKDNGIIIGKKGKTLNSFEFLINSLFEGVKIEVDVEGFKEKREKTLRELAKKMVEKVLTTEKAVKLNPMPPRERKIIHEVVNSYEGIDTYSEGKDPKRYIVIRIKRQG